MNFEELDELLSDEYPDQHLYADFNFVYDEYSEKWLVTYKNGCVGPRAIAAIMEVCRQHLEVSEEMQDAYDEREQKRMDEIEGRREEDTNRAVEEYEKRNQGFVYLCSTKKNPLIKIGWSRNPSTREKTLQSEDPELVMLEKFPAVKEDERMLHRLFAEQRVRGEWFSLHAQDILKIKRIMTNSLFV